MAKANKTDTLMREIMHQGSEPRWPMLNHVNSGFRADYVLALNWIHNAVDQDQLRQELETLLRAQGRGDKIELLDQIAVPTLHTMGKVAYCVNRGAQLADSSLLYVARQLEGVTQQVLTQPAAQDVPMFDTQAETPAGRVNHIYKMCYSLLDNLRAQVCSNKVTLAQVPEQVKRIIAQQKGDSGKVLKRLREHYAQSLTEAQQDATLKSWVKCLREIVRALGGEVPKVNTKAQEKKPVQKISKRGTRQIEIKPRVRVGGTHNMKVQAPKQVEIKSEGKLTVAAQVRELIKRHKAQLDQDLMIQKVMQELGLNKARGRSVVMAFWNKVEVA
jgi:hypothetical protein